MIGLVAIIALTAFAFGVMYGNADKDEGKRQGFSEMAKK